MASTARPATAAATNWIPLATRSPGTAGWGFGLINPT